MSVCAVTARRASLPTPRRRCISGSGRHTQPEMNCADADLVSAVGGLALDATNDEVPSLRVAR